MGLTNVLPFWDRWRPQKKSLQEGFFAVSQESGLPRMRKNNGQLRKSKNIWEEKKNPGDSWKNVFRFRLPGKLAGGKHVCLKIVFRALGAQLCDFVFRS